MFNSLLKWISRREAGQAPTQRRGDVREAEVSVYDSETPGTHLMTSLF